MADTSTDAVAPASVWVQLYWDDGITSGDAIKIQPVPDDVDDLKKAVQEEFLVAELRGMSKAQIRVYAPDTTVPIPNGTELLDPGDSVSFTTTSKAHLIMIAPKPQQQQQQQNGELRFCFRIHCCIQTRSNLVFNLLFEFETMPILSILHSH